MDSSLVYFAKKKGILLLGSKYWSIFCSGFCISALFHYYCPFFLFSFFVFPTTVQMNTNFVLHCLNQESFFLNIDSFK